MGLFGFGKNRDAGSSRAEGKAEKAAGGQVVNEELYKACYKPDAKKVKELLDAGASPDSVDEAGTPCLIAAAKYGYLDIVRLLLSRGASANAVDKWNNTVIRFAIDNGFIEIVKLLIEYKADVNSSSGDRTALQAAMRNLDFEMADLLISNGMKLSDEAVIEAIAPVGFLESSILVPERLSSFYARYNARVGSLSPALYAETVKYLKGKGVKLESKFSGLPLEAAITAKIAKSGNIIDTAGTARGLIEMLKKVR